MKFKMLLGASLSISIGIVSLGILIPTVSAAETIPLKRTLEHSSYKTITYGGDSITVVPFARTKMTYKTSTGIIVDTYNFTNYTTKEKHFITPIKTIKLNTTDTHLLLEIESVL